MLLRASRVAFVVAMVALGGCDEREVPIDPQRFAAPDVRALLDGLREGDLVDGARVVRLGPPRDGTIQIELARGDLRFTVGIVKKGTSPPEHPPPIVTERYEIGVGNVVPTDASVSADSLLPVAHAIEARVKRRETSVPMPSGL